jgi:hypothetical protein
LPLLLLRLAPLRPLLLPHAPSRLLLQPLAQQQPSPQLRISNQMGD